MNPHHSTRHQETRIGGSLRSKAGRYEIATGIRFPDHMLGSSPNTAASTSSSTQKRSRCRSAPTWRTRHRARPALPQASAIARGINRAVTSCSRWTNVAVVALRSRRTPRVGLQGPGEGALVATCRPSSSRIFRRLRQSRRAPLHAGLYGRSNITSWSHLQCFARAMKYACSKDARLKDQLPFTKVLL